MGASLAAPTFPSGLATVYLKKLQNLEKNE